MFRLAVLSFAILGLTIEARADSGLDPLLGKLAAEGRFSGAVVLMEDGKERYARGFGWADQDQRRPFTPDTPSDGGSIAKPMTAAAILRLSTSGRLDLDAPAVRLVPDFPHPETTLRELLAHSAGLPDYGDFQALLDAGRPVFTVDLLRETARKQPKPSFPPGTAFEYCNLCYDVLGAALEAVERRSYGEIVRTDLLQPAGATTAFARPARLADWPVARTIGYSGAALGAKPFDQLDNEGFHGASNMMVSARDLAAFAQGWLGEPFASLRLVAVETVAIGEKRSGIRLGSWYCNAESTLCNYSGHHQGFDSFAVWNSSTGRAAAFVSNGGLSPWDLHRLQRVLVAATRNEAATMPPEPRACRTAVSPAKAIGRYALGDTFVDVRRSGETLWVAPQGMAESQLFPVSPGTYYAPGLDAYLCFAHGSRLLWFSAMHDAAGTLATTR
jgi:CubicO group peptidase (beta-lactamase class C family)